MKLVRTIVLAVIAIGIATPALAFEDGWFIPEGVTCEQAIEAIEEYNAPKPEVVVENEPVVEHIIPVAEFVFSHTTVGTGSRLRIWTTVRVTANVDIPIGTLWYKVVVPGSSTESTNCNSVGVGEEGEFCSLSRVKHVDIERIEARYLNAKTLHRTVMACGLDERDNVKSTFKCSVEEGPTRLTRVPTALVVLEYYDGQVYASTKAGVIRPDNLYLTVSKRPCTTCQMNSIDNYGIQVSSEFGTPVASYSSTLLASVDVGWVVIDRNFTPLYCVKKDYHATPKDFDQIILCGSW